METPDERHKLSGQWLSPSVREDEISLESLERGPSMIEARRMFPGCQTIVEQTVESVVMCLVSATMVEMKSYLRCIGQSPAPRREEGHLDARYSLLLID